MLRRALLAAATAAVFSVGLPLGLPDGAAPAALAPAAHAEVRAPVVLPDVDMGAVVLASQVEGYRGSQPSIGDDPSTRLVQAALKARGISTNTDGRYSRTTTSAYIKFQRSLGYRGIDANGIPGLTSLTVLGKGRFNVVDPVVVGSRKDSYSGKRVSTRTRQMLAAADSKVSWKIQVSQGSYCSPKCAKASAGTHDAGAIDISVKGLSSAKRWQTVQALRQVGFAAWLRTKSQCTCWSDHIHAVAINDTDLWQRNGKYTNRDQVADYFVGRNGLSGHAKDNTPVRYRAAFTTWERYSLAA